MGRSLLTTCYRIRKAPNPGLPDQPKPRGLCCTTRWTTGANNCCLHEVSHRILQGSKKGGNGIGLHHIPSGQQPVFLELGYDSKSMSSSRYTIPSVRRSSHNAFNISSSTFAVVPS